MTAATDNLEDLLLDHITGTASLTMPPGIYLALYTTSCTDSTPGTEVSGGGYGVQQIFVNPASGGVTSNNAVITFPNMPTCTVVAVAVWRDSSTADPNDYWLHGDVTPLPVTSGTDLTVDIGELVLSLD